MVYSYAYAIYRVLRTEGYLMVRASVGSVRRAVAEHVGSKVKVRSNLGRHKYDVTEGCDYGNISLHLSCAGEKRGRE